MGLHFLTSSQEEGLEAVGSWQSDFLQTGWGAGYLGLGQDRRAEQGRAAKALTRRDSGPLPTWGSGSVWRAPQDT